MRGIWSFVRAVLRMSRVYDTPRYEDQTLNKVWMHIQLASERFGLHDLRGRFGNTRIHSKDIDIIKYELQQMELIDAEEGNCKHPMDVDDTDLFDQFYLGDAVQRPGAESGNKLVATGLALHKILSQCPQKTIWCDFDAAIRLVEGYLSGNYIANLSDKDRRIVYKSSMDAVDICVLSLAACRLGSEVTDVIKGKIQNCFAAGKEWGNMLAWNRGFELVRLKSMTPEIYQVHDKLRDHDFDVGPEEFSASNTKACKTLGIDGLYRIMGLYIFETHDAYYVLDYSSVDQVHQVSKMWEGFYKYASNYRLTGTRKKLPSLGPWHITKLKEWITSSLKTTNYINKLSRSMKQSLALMQNDLHPEAEKLNVNLKEKSEKLKELIKNVLPLPSYWHEAIRALKLPGRIELDVANMFYALPAPDCNLKMLFERASVYMQKANTANAWDFHEFMNYCMTIDFCRARTIYRKDVSFNKIPGYEFEDEPWYKACLTGRFKLPKDCDFGKV